MLRLELATLSEEGYDLPLTGFDEEDLARVLAQQEADDGLTDEDSAPDEPLRELGSRQAPCRIFRSERVPVSRNDIFRFPDQLLRNAGGPVLVPEPALLPNIGSDCLQHKTLVAQ
jgi:hypothetical protein